MDQKRVNVEFEAKEKARKAGANVVNGKWMSKKDGPDEFENTKDMSVLVDLVNRISRDDSELKEYVDPGVLTVPDDCLCNEEENAFWEELLNYKYWNALVAVLKIKESGLPRTTEQRASLLNYFASTSSYRSGEQYDVSYKDLCDYCEKFDKAYNFKVVSAIKRKHGITGFNFEMSLNKSELTDEEKALFRFVFPIKVKTMVRERYLENEVLSKDDQELDASMEAESFPC